MKDNTNSNNQRRNNDEDVLRDDLKQKNKPGSDTRAGGTYSDVNAGEWKLGDDESERSVNPEKGSAISDSKNEDFGHTPAG